MPQHPQSQAETQVTDLSWATLHIFNIYRLLFVGALGTFSFLGIGSFTNHNLLQMSRIILIIYFVFAVLMLIPALLRSFSYYKLTVFEVIIDLLMLSLLLYCSRQMTDIFIILINSVIAAGSIVTAGRIPFLFAALATMGTLIIKGGLASPSTWDTTELILSGFYSISFFATAALAFGLSMRIRAGESLVIEREKEVLNLEHLNKMIISQMGIGVIVLDEQERIIFVNQSALQSLNWSSSEFPAHLIQLPKAFTEEYMNVKVKTHDLQLRFSCDYLHISTRVVLLQKGQSNSGYAILFLEDSRAAYKKAQELKLLSLGRLTASVAHEIRNPLTAIAQAAQLLAEKTQVDPNSTKLVEIIDRQALRIEGIIKNILQLPSGKKADRALIRVQDWVNSFLAEFMMSVDNRSEIGCTIEPVDLMILFDSEQLHQILFNLCDNAAYFSQKILGYPKFSLAFKLNAKENNAEIRICDQGPGIEPNVRAYLFEPFFTSKNTGTGLGLYIALQLCQANDASLSYESVEKGACFVIKAQKVESSKLEMRE